LKLLGFALLVKHLDGLQPACLRRSVQFPQLAQSSLARTIHLSHPLDQRRVGMILTVLAALMRPQKHLSASLSSAALGFKRVGLHYIALSDPAIAKTRLVLLPTSKIAEFGTSATNLG
jgi:hypothetical protein